MITEGYYIGSRHVKLLNCLDRALLHQNRLPEDFEISRPRERQISIEYDPDNDDYQMQVKPELPEALALTETQLIKKQITQLQSRMDQGGLT